MSVRYRMAGLLSRSLPAKLELAPTFVEGLTQEVLMLCLSIVLVVCVGQQSGAQHGAPEASPAVQLRALKAQGYLRAAQPQSVRCPGHR